MATLETFQEYKDVCDNLMETCEKVPEKDRKLFEQMANTFQGWVALFEPDYWKISEAAMKKNTENVKALIAQVQQFIDITQKGN